MPTLSNSNPVSSPQEGDDAKLTQLSSEITTLTQLMGEADHRGLIRLTDLFSRARQRKVEQTSACIAGLTVVGTSVDSPPAPRPPPPGGRTTKNAQEADEWDKDPVAAALDQDETNQCVAERSFVLVDGLKLLGKSEDVRLRRLYQSPRRLALVQAGASFKLNQGT